MSSDDLIFYVFKQIFEEQKINILSTNFTGKQTMLIKVVCHFLVMFLVNIISSKPKQDIMETTCDCGNEIENIFVLFQ